MVMEYNPASFVVRQSYAVSPSSEFCDDLKLGRQTCELQVISFFDARLCAEVLCLTAAKHHLNLPCCS